MESNMEVGNIIILQEGVNKECGVKEKELNGNSINLIFKLILFVFYF